MECFAEYTPGYLRSRCIAVPRCNRIRNGHSDWRSHVNRRIGFVLIALAVAGILTVHGAFSQTAPTSTRRALSLPDDNPQLPFSGAILAGNTLYMSGRIGLDPKTGKAPEQA